VSKDSDKFRNMAARSLRAARATSDAAFGQTCFGVAAIYKRLALEDEILRGDRQRSGPRKMEQLLPQAPLRSDDVPIVCEPGDSGPDAIAKAGGLQCH
jgi:hypothetical protein